jgi:hypothetical protein
MTCVVGMEYEGETIIGFDSFGAADFCNAGVRLDAKAWVYEGPDYNFVIGGTSSYRMLQILRYHAEPPNPQDDDTEWDPDDADEWWLRWMVTKYVPKVRQALKEHGYTKVENGTETGGTWLVGVAGYLFSVDSDFHVCRTSYGYNAVGSGAYHALGALHALGARLNGPDPAHLPYALDAAQHHGAGVREPFTLITTERSR